MNASKAFLSRKAGVLAGMMLALPVAYAGGTEAFQDFDTNYITLTGSIADISGNEAAFQAAAQKSKRGTFGIEDLRFTRELSKSSELTFEGKLLSGIDDYLAKMRLTKEELGSFEVGYKRFATFYDGVGGFFANGNTWMPLQNEFLSVNRGTFWMDATFARPNAPVFHLRYSNELRNGTKESTVTGDTDFTGIPIWSTSSLNPISANRKVVAGYINLNERHEILEASMLHTIGNTKIDLKVVADNVNNDDARFFDRYPGELKPWPAIPSTPSKLISATQANSQISGYDRQGVDMKTLSFIGRFETELSSTIKLTGGASYVKASGDLSGERMNTAYIATNTGMIGLIGGFTNNGRPAYSYQSLGGDIRSNTITANLGLDIRAIPDLHITTGVKAEQLYTNVSNPVNYISTFYDGVTFATTPRPAQVSNISRAKERAWVPELSLRYTGIKNVSLFADADYRFSPGDERNTNGTVGPAFVTVKANYTSVDERTVENHGSYKAGANWLANPKATFRAEVFMKNHHNGFYDNVTAGDKYLLGFERKGYQLSATVKPVQSLSFVTKYSNSTGRMWTTVDAGNKFESMDSKTHQIGETINWSPVKQFYMQANVNVVYDIIRSAYTRSEGVARDVVDNSDNDYITASMIMGVAVSDNTDFEVQASYYRADNFRPMYTSVAYGVDAKDYNYTVGIKHRFSKTLVGALKVGYVRMDKPSDGGYTDYKGTLAYVSLTQAF